MRYVKGRNLNRGYALFLCGHALESSLTRCCVFYFFLRLLAQYHTCKHPAVWAIFSFVSAFATRAIQLKATGTAIDHIIGWFVVAAFAFLFFAFHGQ